MKIKQVMTRDPYLCDPETPLTEVAAQMRDLDVGMIPVCDGKRIQGMVTDRDIVVRAVAEELDLAETVADEVMTPDVLYCFEDDELSQASEVMEKHQVRRLVVLDRGKQLVGIVSLADLATKGGDSVLSGEVLGEICQSGQPAIAKAPDNTPADDSWPLESIDPALRSETYPH